MPLVTYSPAPICLRVSDKLLPGNGRLGQTARFWQFGHTHPLDGVASCTTSIKLLVTCHELTEAGELGPALLTHPSFQPRELELVASDETLVDEATGAILHELAGLNPQQRQELLDSLPQPTMLQGQFFARLRDLQPVLITSMLTQHIQQADALGRFQ